MAHVLTRVLLPWVLFSLCGCLTLKQGQGFGDLSYPMSIKMLDVDGMQIAYSDTGAASDPGADPGAASGPGADHDGAVKLDIGPKEGREQPSRTLLLIHGLGSYLPVWSRNVQELSRAYRVVAIDLPGYGKSSKGNYKYSMEFFAQIVDRVIDELHLARVTLVGHSMGGQIALTHALLFPERYESQIDSLVLLAPAGLEPFKPDEGSWLAEATSKDFIKATPTESVYVNLAATFYDMPREADFMVADRLRIINGPDFDGFAYAMSRSVAAMIDEPVFERLGEITAPALVIFGEEDGLIPNPLLHGGSTRKVAEQGVARMKQAQLVMVKRAGHMVQLERPAEVDRAILGFLKSLPQ